MIYLIFNFSTIFQTTHNNYIHIYNTVILSKSTEKILSLNSQYSFRFWSIRPVLLSRTSMKYEV